MKKVKGDLLQMADNGEFDIIVHGCNCFNTMENGIAKQIRDKWPIVYEYDMYTIPGDIDKLGTVDPVLVDNANNKPLMIINAYTQYYYGTNGWVEYLAIKQAFAELSKMVSHTPDVKIGIPKIGAGLAKGNWHTIHNIIEECMNGFDVTVVEYERA